MAVFSRFSEVWKEHSGKKIDDEIPEKKKFKSIYYISQLVRAL